MWLAKQIYTPWSNRFVGIYLVKKIWSIDVSSYFNILQFGHSPYSIGNKTLQRLHLKVDSLEEVFPFDHFGFFSRDSSDINYIGKSCT